MMMVISFLGSRVEKHPLKRGPRFFLQTDRIFKGHGVCVSSWEVFNWSKGQPEVATPPFKPTVLFVLPR